MSVVDKSTIPNSAVPITRSAISVAEKVTMGSFVNPDLGPPVHLIGMRHPALTDPITDDAEMATDTTNPDQVQDPAVLLHFVMTLKEPAKYMAGAGPVQSHRMSGPV